MRDGSAGICENLWNLWFQFFVLKRIELRLADNRENENGRMAHGG